MLKIRPEQMAVFQQMADAAFVKRLAEHLRSKYASVGVLLPTGVVALGQIPTATLLEMVRGGIARARTHGLSYESSLAAFLALMIEAAPNFDEYPRVRQILTDESVPPNGRLDQLLNQAVLEECWAEIKKNYDVAAWALPTKE
jgi:hypothetical protein